MPYNPKSKENLNVYTSDQDREQASINGRKGGKARQEQRRAAQREKDEWAELLSLAMDNGKAEKITNLRDAKSKNLTIGKAMKVKLITEALKGNIKAYECIMRYCGANELENATPEEIAPDNGFIQALNGAAVEVWKDEPKED